MGRTLLQYTVRNTTTNNFQGNTSPRLEVYNVSTQVQTAATSGATQIVVVEGGGFQQGDQVWIDTETVRSISSIAYSSGVSGQAQLTLNTGVSAAIAENAAVALKRRSGSGATTDDYADIWENPDFTENLTDTDIFPWTADSENQWEFFIKPGEYGVRYSNSDNDTLRLDHSIEFNEDSDQVPNNAAGSISGGLHETINRLPNDGGTVRFEHGTITLQPIASASQVVLGEGVRLIGRGPENTILRLGDDAAQYIDLGMIVLNDRDDVHIEGLTIDGNSSNAANQANDDYDCIYTQGNSKDLTIKNVVLKNPGRHGLQVGNVAGTNDRLRLIDVRVEDASLMGFKLARLQNAVINGCRVTSSGSTALEIDATTGLSQDVQVRGCNFNRATAPTYLHSSLSSVEGGELIELDNCEDFIIENNVIWDCRNVTVDANNFGRGLHVDPTTCDRISVYNNQVGFTAGMGIACPNNSHVVGNFLYRIGLHPLLIDVPAAINYGSIFIHSNMMVDPNEENSANIHCIHSGLDNLSPTACTINKLSIIGNQLRDSRSRTTSGLNLETKHADGSTVTDLILMGNDFSDATKLMTWSSDPSFGSYLIRDNLSADAYSGRETLAAGVATVVNANWPATAGGGIVSPYFMHARNGVGSSTTFGHLNAAYSGAATQLTLTAFQQASATTAESTDVSLVVWEFIGDPN